MQNGNGHPIGVATLLDINRVAIAHVQGLFERIVTPVAPESCSASGSTAKKDDDSLAPWEELTGILATRPETWKIIKPMILAGKLKRRAS